jgi:hypothetical protein
VVTVPPRVLVEDSSDDGVDDTQGGGRPTGTRAILEPVEEINGATPLEAMHKSTDGGATFGDPVTVTKLNTPYSLGDLFLTDRGGQYSFRTNAFPQAVVNPVTGDIYVAYNDWGNAKGTDKGNIYLTESGDGGKHWSKSVQVNDDQATNDQWFPALAVTPDGSHVGLFWYDRRLDPADWLIGRFGAIGAVSGHTVTFGANFRIL